MRRGGVLGLAMVGVLAACSSGAGTPVPTLTEAWRNSEIHPIGQPVAVGDTVVVYGTVGQELRLYGVAVSDGTVRQLPLRPQGGAVPEGG
jgi:hypothetical protein